MPHRWSGAATIRRKQIESGLDLTFSKVFIPLYRDLISSRMPKTVLDIGAGTGHLALMISEMGPEVDAIEPSSGMSAVASEVLYGSPVRLYEVSAEEFRPDRVYDVIVSHLVAQTLSNLGTFLAAVGRLLTHSGDFIFSVPHPCFWNSYQTYFDPKTFDYMREQETEMTLRISLDTGTEISGVPYHHHSLTSYSRALAMAGLFLSSLEEIYPSPDVEILYPKPWRTPRYLVFLARKYDSYCSGD